VVECITEGEGDKASMHLHGVHLVEQIQPASQAVNGFGRLSVVGLLCSLGVVHTSLA
jgi:hypothetical protein